MDNEKLEELNRKNLSGELTDEEFKRKREQLFADENDPVKRILQVNLPFGMDEKTYLALMNFSILLPTFGWIVFIVLWSNGKYESPLVDKQGRYILNWLITWASIYIISLILFPISLFTVIFGGFKDITLLGGINVFLLIIMAILNIVFPIIGGLKGANKETWKYPISIPFFK